MGDLAGKVAVVTGASRGIGRQVAVLLAQEGASVVLAARTEQDLALTADEIQSKGGDAFPVRTDITDENQVENLIERAISRYGRINFLCNSAGFGVFGSITESKTEDWDRMMDANLKGMYLCSKYGLVPMLERGKGHIVNVISIAARVPFKFASGYCASKFGALGFTKVLSEEVRDKGIRVTAVCPGATDTPFWDSIEEKPSREDMTPPERVAETVLFVLYQSEGITTDEIWMTPPLGIL